MTPVKKVEDGVAYGYGYPQFGPQQGWECPKCGGVYAPFMPACTRCPQQTQTTTGTSSDPSARTEASS